MENTIHPKLTSVTPCTLNSNDRNYGIDALRIVSMIMIVILHIIGSGGLLEAVSSNKSSVEAVWFLRIMTYCAVNCYALISGFVGIKSKFKFTNIAVLWLQVAFYSVIISIIFSVVMPGSVSGEEIFRSFFPTMTASQSYWYFNCYIITFFFIPIFNAAINNIPKKEMGVIIIALLFLSCFEFSIFRTGWLGAIPGDIFRTNNGYSPLWLSLLYILGAYISKYNLFSIVPKWATFSVYIFMVILTYGIKLYGKGGNAFVSYISPTILVCSVSLLLFFSKCSFSHLIPIIRFLSPLTFGVYLIHVHPTILKVFINNKFVFLAEWHTALTILGIIGCSILIFIICAVIDYLRLLIFKLLKIKSTLLKLEKRIFDNNKKTTEGLSQ